MEYLFITITPRSTRYQNTNIITAVQRSVNNVKAVRHHMNSYNGDDKVMASRKGYSRCSDCTHMLELIQLQEKVIEHRSKGTQALIKWMGVGVTIMMLALNEDFCYHLRKRCKVQILIGNVKVNCLTKAKKLLNKLRNSAELETIWFFSNGKNSAKTSFRTYRTAGALSTIHVMSHIS